MFSFENKTVLITGATGLLGTHLVRRMLSYKDCYVIALGRRMNKLEEVFDGYIGNGELVLMEGDVTDKMPEIGRSIDYIFHAASPIAGDIIRNHPVSVIKPNVVGTINCLEYLKKEKIEKGIAGKMVVFSSATVYANTGEKDVIAHESETSIADTLEASNAPYSESKRMAEVIARSYTKEYELDVLIARFSYLYGYTKQAPNTAFYEFINKAIRGEELLLNTNAAPRRDNIYVEDAIDGLFYICEKGASGESYNVSSGLDSGNFAAIDEIAETIAEVANEMVKGVNITVSFRENQISRKPGIILDNSKLKELGWRVNTSIRDGVEKTFSSYICLNEDGIR